MLSGGDCTPAHRKLVELCSRRGGEALAIHTRLALTTGGQIPTAPNPATSFPYPSARPWPVQFLTNPSELRSRPE